MTLIDCDADNWGHPNTDAVLAGVGLGAEVCVAAGCAVVLGRIGAEASRGIAHAGYVALIEGSADHRIGARARAGLAGVTLGAEVRVIAGCAVRLGRIGADTARGIAHAGIVAIVPGAREWLSNAGPSYATV